MCGRARCTLSPAQAARAFGFVTTSADAGGGGGDGPAVPTLDHDRFRPSYNVSPGAYLPVGAVRAHPAGGGDGGGRADGEGPVIQCMQWGLVPSFSGRTQKPDHFRMFNARSESVKEKASFRRLISKNRCLVAVEGFYEWKKDGSKRQPFYIHFQDHRPFVFAALYDTWTNSDGEMIHTFTILTTRASTYVKWLHDRMPVILGNVDAVNAWINDASVNLEEITAPYEGSDLVHMGPIEKHISKFFTKKSTAYNQSGKPDMSTEVAETHASRAAKVEYGESVENQPEGVKQPGEGVKDEAVTLEPHLFGKPWSIKLEDNMTLTDATIGKQDDLEDTEVKGEMKVANSGWSSSRPTKRENVAIAASNGQTSLLSFFSRK